MTKPIINGFNEMAELIVQKYERYLPTAFDESLSILQKLNKIIQYLNEMGLIVNGIVKQWNEVMEWIMNEGLTESVNEKLDEMATDGTLSQIINVEMMGSLSDLTTTFKNNLVGAINENNSKITQMDVRTKQANIMDYGAYKDGTHVIETTQALINAGKSGKTVFFPEGTYVINQTVVLSQFTQFVSNGGVTIKVQADVDVFWVTADNKVSNFTLDLYTLDSYTKSVFEISSRTRNTMGTYNQAGQYTCKIEKIELKFSHNNTVDVSSAVFNIWAKVKDESGSSYPAFAYQFFNVSISEIYVHGAVAYFMRNWTWNENYYVSSSDVVAWITGLTIKDVSVFGSFLYGIFDAPSEALKGDEHYRGCSPMWIDNMRIQFGNRVKRFAYLTDGIRVFKNCIAWDFPGASITLLKRTQATYIINNRPYVNMDNGYGSRYYFFDVVDTSGNTVTDKNWIDSRLVAYQDGTKPMNEIIEPTNFSDAPIIIKKQGYKSWQIIRPSNNNLVFVPSATINGVDWDYSKQVDINGDTGRISAPTINEGGISLSSKYAPKVVANPASPTSAGTYGEMSIDGGYLYVCTGTNTWRRTPLTTW